MKRMLIMVAIAALTVSMSFGQFTKGTKSVSSLFSYESSNSGEDDDDGSTELSIEPAGSYFFMDNIAADVMIDMTTKGNYMGSDEDLKTSLIGFGATYYMNNMYGGLGFAMSSSTFADNDPSKANFIAIKAGYLHSMVENWYFDIGLRYNMGMGKYKMGSEEGDDNKSSHMTLGLGVVTFF